MTRRVRKLDALIVGQGFGGMYILHRARGMGSDVLAIIALPQSAT